MGTGVPEGLVASETSNNGLTGGALIPLLSLGIPGDSTTAVLISAFMFQGIQVGPLFIAQNPDTWNCILVGMLLANIIMFLCMFYPIKWISRLVYIPKQRLYPVIMMICIVGAYATKMAVSLMCGRFWDLVLLAMCLVRSTFHRLVSSSALFWVRISKTTSSSLLVPQREALRCSSLGQSVFSSGFSLPFPSGIPSITPES